MRDNITKLALDIGNDKIKFILGELSTEGLNLRVLDYLEVNSEGVKRSKIENLELLSAVIKNALDELSSRNSIEFDKVSLGISSDKIKSKTEHGYIEFEEKEIEEQEITNLIQEVKIKILEEDEIVIEQEIYNVRVNSSGILKNPLGQIGKTLQGDVHLITIKKKELETLEEVINSVGLRIENIFLNASASAKATLETEDKQMGVALIDIGEGSTDIAIYKNNKIIYTKSLAIGGMHFVNDISYLLEISTRQSKEILEKMRNKEYKDGKIEIEGREYKLSEIKEIIDARTGDLINFISKTIEESGFNGYLGKGITFTGGAVSIDEIFSKVSSEMECGVRKVSPFKLRGLKNVNPSMSTVIGILLNKLELELKERNKNNSKDEEIEKEIEQDIIEDHNIGINENIFRQEDFEENLKEKKSNDGTIKKVKKWLSNFI